MEKNEGLFNLKVMYLLSWVAGRKVSSWTRSESRCLAEDYRGELWKWLGASFLGCGFLDYREFSAGCSKTKAREMPNRIQYVAGIKESALSISDLEGQGFFMFFFL